MRRAANAEAIVQPGCQCMQSLQVAATGPGQTGPAAPTRAWLHGCAFILLASRHIKAYQLPLTARLNDCARPGCAIETVKAPDPLD